MKQTELQWLSGDHLESSHWLKTTGLWYRGGVVVPSTHVKYILSELLWFNAGKDPQQQVHDG